MTVAILLWAGLGAALLMLAMLAWSIAVPQRRLWPPRQSTPLHKAVVWSLTVLIYASAILLGIIDWNRFDWPAPIRWSVGLSMILSSNWIVWQSALAIGMGATSGDTGDLKTDGFYRWSRNPQYVADIAILIGWSILSASLWSLPIVAAGILVLMLAPFAEEPWMRAIHGEAFVQYCARTRRYL